MSPPVEKLPPSEKQLRFAALLAERCGVDLPEAVLEDKAEMKKKIDELLGKQPPTEKQLAFAMELAEAANHTIPPETLASSSLLRLYIGLRTAGVTGFERTPSDVQLDFARSLAAKNGVEVPGPVLRDARHCSRFIDDLKSRASPKQQRYVKELSAATGSVVRANVVLDKQACAGAISQLGKLAPPTERQLSFVGDLARQLDREVPKEALETRAACSALLDQWLPEVNAMRQEASGKASP